VITVLRLLLIAVYWKFVWSIVKPKTQLRRVLRALLLLVGLLGILFIMRNIGNV